MQDTEETTTAKLCPVPSCGHVLRLEKRERPQRGAMFVHEDWWVCTNKDCGHAEVAE
jgi:hypothetical protein